MKWNLFVGVWISIASALEVAYAQDQLPQLRFIEEPMEVYVREGVKVRMACKVSGDATGCMWTRDGNIAFFGIANSYVYEGSPAAGDCSLTIQRTTKQDEATFVCQIPGGPQGVMASKSAKISFVVPPNPPIIRYRNRNQNLVTGQTITIIPSQPAELECISRNGKPASTLEWIVNLTRANVGFLNRTSEPDSNLKDSILIWNSRDLSKPGEYEAQCFAHHPGYDQPLVAKVKLIYQQPTRHVQVQVNGRIVSENELNDLPESALLTCVGDGYPTPEYEWLQRESENAEWILKTVGDSLHVDNSHGGQYMCRAKDFGAASGNLAPTSLPMSIKSAEVESSNIGLVIGVVIACVVIITIATIILLFMYRRKVCIFAPRDSKAQPEENRPLSSSDAEAAKPDDNKPVEETTTIPADTPTENLKKEEVNGKGVNGKNDTPLVKNFGPGEVVYAQLELDNVNRTAKIKSPDYEKTEYAEIQFKNENRI